MGEAILTRAGSGSGSGGSDLFTQHLITKIFDKNTSFQVPSNIIGNKVFVRLFGGGGGHSSNISWATVGSGGGNMNYGPVNVTPGEIIPITIGQGGGVLQNGGTTSFGSYLSATGGEIGNYITGCGGNGGTGGGGGYTNNSFTSNFINNCGHGGHGYYGGGGGGCGALFIHSGNYIKTAGNGGNGGMYGGGGGGGGGIWHMSYNIQYPGGKCGIGGLYGGNGGNGCDLNGNNSLSDAVGKDGTAISENGVYYAGTGGGAPASNKEDYNGSAYWEIGSSVSFRGGAGGGGYGGCGGNAIAFSTYMSNSYWTCGCGGGGGGGYCSNGSSLVSKSYAVGRGSTGGGGGGYGGGEPVSYAGGGGYSNLYAYGSGDIDTNGGNGICIVQYYMPAI